MARVRKSEQEYINARKALQRQLQRTNKAFGSSMRIQDIVDVPTPAQAKKMSYKELKAATRKIEKARKDNRGQKVTFVPTGVPGQVAKVPTKDYNAAMANLGKANKAMRERNDILNAARPPKKRGVRPVSTRDVNVSKSKITPFEQFNPAAVFTGGSAKGNIDKIIERFQKRGRMFAKKPRDWQEQDKVMRKNFERMFRDSMRYDLLEKLDKLSNEQFLWLMYENNFSAMVDMLGLRYVPDGATPEIIEQIQREVDENALDTVLGLIDEASMIEFK